MIDLTALDESVRLEILRLRLESVKARAREQRLLTALRAADHALNIAARELTHYGGYNLAAGVLSRCNGYDGSPDIKAILKEFEKENNDEKN
jgi:hypothetical protein